MYFMADTDLKPVELKLRLILGCILLPHRETLLPEIEFSAASIQMFHGNDIHVIQHGYTYDKVHRLTGQTGVCVTKENPFFGHMPVSMMLRFLILPSLWFRESSPTRILKKHPEQ